MDGIKERHGVQCGVDQRVTFTQRVEAIHVRVDNGVGQCSTTITATEARYLARKLYRLARRIEEGRGIMVDWTNRGQAEGKWPASVRIERAPYDPDAHVITSVGAFAFCRSDKFCRCRRCKPSLANGAKAR